MKLDEKDMHDLEKRIERTESKPILLNEKVLTFPFTMSLDVAPKFEAYLYDICSYIIGGDYADDQYEILFELEDSLKRYEQIVSAKPIWPVKKPYQLLAQNTKKKIQDIKKEIELAEKKKKANRKLAFWGGIGFHSKESCLGEYPSEHYCGLLFIKNYSSNFGFILSKELKEKIESVTMSHKEKENCESRLMHELSKSPIFSYGKKWNSKRAESFKEIKKHTPYTLTLSLPKNRTFQENEITAESVSIRNILDFEDFIVGTPSVKYRFKKLINEKNGDRMIIIKMMPYQTDKFGFEQDLFEIGKRKDLARILNETYNEVLVPNATLNRSLPSPFFSYEFHNYWYGS